MKKKTKNLSFKTLRKFNLKRDKLKYNSIKEWSETDLGCALAGEAGELCNYIKKRRRLNFEGDKYKDDISKELADIILYCDLLAAKYDIDLGEAVINKYNEVSDRWKLDIKIL